MEDTQIKPQAGTAERARRLLPFGQLGLLAFAGAVFCLLGTLLFVRLAAGVLGDRFITFDDQVILRIHSGAAPWITEVMSFFTFLGNPVPIGVFLAIVAFLLWRAGRWIDAAGLILAGAGGGILNQLLKGSFQRVRPELFPRIVEASGYSFPSGHAMGSIVCYGMLAFVGWRVVRTRFERFWLVLDAALLVFAIGLSRVYFGVHFPTDIIGGYIAGAIWLVISIIAVRVAEWQVERRTQGFSNANERR